MAENGAFRSMVTRRRLLAVVGAAGAALSKPAWAQRTVDLPLPGGPGAREITTAFPQKGPLILQRTRPPLLETPFEVFDEPSVFTPNDRFYVRWHWGIPTEVNVDTFRLVVRGHVRTPLSLSLDEVVRLPLAELAAVNQ